ncbi:MAG: N-acetylmuramoyl-L-alanine amidase [Armatimonadetes bacterium]|nr:N-acetylmuramoyl-L-alanine amidase [Armatimonadota bacterium]
MLTSLLMLCLVQDIPPKPPIVTRAEWRAKPMLPGAIPHVVHTITIHHTGVKSNRNRSLEDKLAGLQAFSQREDKLANGKTKPAWPDVPYHYYIAIDGRIGEGRDPNFQGDTNTEYNPKGHLLIVVEGEFNTEKPTQEQLGSLVVLTRWCCWRYHVSPDTIAGHGDHSKQTDCPGDNLKSFLPLLRKQCAE